ncbi:MAG: hypothetical protein MSG64_10825 [Pyrinomonadaceae bacterium MAG19_C2-C3]|nr:hypothetical protein [Pyrinomonadaceae bacterium MAG19_C2-C3]
MGDAKERKDSPAFEPLLELLHKPKIISLENRALRYNPPRSTHAGNITRGFFTSHGITQTLIAA